MEIVLMMRMTTKMLAVNIGARTTLSRVHLLHIRRKRKRKRRKLFCFPTHARPKFTNLAKRSQPRHLRRFPERPSPNGLAGRLALPLQPVLEPTLYPAPPRPATRHARTAVTAVKRFPRTIPRDHSQKPLRHLLRSRFQTFCSPKKRKR